MRNNQEMQHNQTQHNNLETRESTAADTRQSHVGYTRDKQAIVHRLSRIEGQVRALKAMIERDEYCIDVVTQISSTTSALKSVAQLMLNDHLEHCVHDAIAYGHNADEKVAEVQKVITKLIKS